VRSGDRWRSRWHRREGSFPGAVDVRVFVQADVPDFLRGQGAAVVHLQTFGGPFLIAAFVRFVHKDPITAEAAAVGDGRFGGDAVPQRATGRRMRTPARQAILEGWR